VRPDQVERLKGDSVNRTGVAAARGDNREDRYEEQEADAVERGSDHRQGSRPDAAQPSKTGKIPHKCDCLPGKIRLQGVELDHRMDREHQRRRFHPGGKPETAASRAKSAAHGLVAPWFQ
jgi:hypothetical protein